MRLGSILYNLIKAVFSAAICIFIITAGYIASGVYFDNTAKSDAIIVLGSKTKQRGIPNACLGARLDHAVDLYKKDYAPKIIMSGGNDSPKGPNEAEEMEKYAVSKGIDEKDVLLEKESTSTYENLAYAKKIMDEQKIKSIIIVTEPFHSPRAALIAKGLNLDFRISSTSTSPCWNRYKYFSSYFVREVFAMILYKWQGKI